jgi:ribosomal protein S18
MPARGGRGGGRRGRPSSDDKTAFRRRGPVRRKVCRFCADKDSRIDFKDSRALSSFVTERGKVVPSRITGNCAKHQPGLIAAARGSATECVLWVLLATGTVTILLDSEAALGFALPFGLPTLGMIICIRRSWSFERTALVGVVAGSLGIIGLTLLAYGDIASVVAAARQQLANSVDLVLATYGSLGVSDSVLATVQAERDALVSGLLEILPALTVLTAALIVIVNLVLLRNWTDASDHVNLRLWQAPDALIWALIVTGFGMFLPFPGIVPVARNLFIIVLGCYFCQGLAIVSYYLERFRLPRGIRVAGYVLIAAQHVVTAMVLALGVFDLWGNFRRLNAGPADVPFHGDGE